MEEAMKKEQAVKEDVCHVNVDVVQSPHYH
jgi:hypothetical protein